MIPSYENVRNIQEWIMFLYENVKKKANYDLEDKIYIMLIEKYNKKQLTAQKNGARLRAKLLKTLAEKISKYFKKYLTTVSKCYTIKTCCKRCLVFRRHKYFVKRQISC